MRGIRTVFARGLGLALIKKLSLRGDSVWVRFFDSCLYERQEMGSSPLDVQQKTLKSAVSISVAFMRTYFMPRDIFLIMRV